MKSYNSNNAYKIDSPLYNNEMVQKKKKKKINTRIDNNRKKVKCLNVGVILKASLTSALLVMCVSSYLFLKNENHQYSNRIADSNSTYEKLKRDNDDYQELLDSKVDLAYVRTRAKELGLKDSKKDAIRYYQANSKEYFMKYKEFEHGE